MRNIQSLEFIDESAFMSCDDLPPLLDLDITGISSACLRDAVAMLGPSSGKWNCGIGRVYVL